ncbi:hypothetical protein [Nocardia blacklockiae]|uniref:hypothetical protein n=1 Tax=Nocardia blacklockiae TaxID=480036 RepID=UPI001895AA06|nr:hypothetical protein [Nocardia blacklockiae]MBF6173977.1 hypothetical protein [Nocardia blacklockiae]
MLISTTLFASSAAAAAVADPEHYRRDDGYYFTTEDGSVGCGIQDTPLADPPVTAGCQQLASHERNRTGCAPNGTDQPTEPTMTLGYTAAELVCLKEGVFTGAHPAYVLPDETTLTVGDFACATRDQRATCTNTTTGHGFLFARGVNLRW